MRLFGIDPGLQHTGWGVTEIHGGRLRAEAWGVISPPARAPIPERLVFLFQNLTQCLTQYAPDAVIVEKSLIGPGKHASLVLAFARSIALLAPALNKKAIYEYDPTLVKKNVTGFGHAQKEQVSFMVSQILSIPKIDESHSADALALTITHFSLSK